MKTVNFNGYECYVNKAFYDNNRTALQLIDKESGLPVCIATVNVPETELQDDEVIIKDYSENQGVLKVLEDAGIVKMTGITRTGMVPVAICKLLI